jgi:transposase
MSGGRPTIPVVLTARERQTLRRWVRRRNTASRLAYRARIVLACAAGASQEAAALAARVTRQTVGRWCRRFVAGRLEGLRDKPRSGAPRRITDAQVGRVVRLALETTPRDAPCWSTRAMARRCGLSQTAVSRTWRALGLRPGQPLRRKEKNPSLSR